MKKHILGLVTMSVAICLTSCGEKKEKTDKLNTMLKKINEKYGEGKIKKGG